MDLYEEIKKEKLNYRIPSSKHFVVFSPEEESDWLETFSEEYSYNGIRCLIINDVTYEDAYKEKTFSFHFNYWENYAKEKAYDCLVVGHNEFPVDKEWIKSLGFDAAEEPMVPFISNLQRPYVKPLTKTYDMLSSFILSVNRELDEFQKEMPSFTLSIRQPLLMSIDFFGTKWLIDFEVREKSISLSNEHLKIRYAYRKGDSVLPFYKEVFDAIYKKRRMKALTDPPKDCFNTTLSLFRIPKVVWEEIYSVYSSRYSALEIENIFASLQKELKENTGTKKKIYFQFQDSPVIIVLKFDFVFFIKVKHIKKEIVLIDFRYSESGDDELLQVAKDEMVSYLDTTFDEFSNKKLLSQA